MISKQKIMELVKEYAKSEEGKAAIKETYGIAYDEKFNKQKARAYVKQMRDILYSHVSTLIKSLAKEDILVGKVECDEKGRWTAKISFAEGALRRESLAPNLYPDGLQDIVLLFERGYHASHSLHGEWHGDIVASRVSREPNGFLQDAVDEFNRKNSAVATASLAGVYDY